MKRYIIRKKKKNKRLLVHDTRTLILNCTVHLAGMDERKKIVRVDIDGESTSKAKKKIH